MKNVLLILGILLIGLSAFSITKLTDIVFKNDVSYAATEVNQILSDYDIKIGNYTGEVDIKIALDQIFNLGYFTSKSYALDEDKGILTINLVSNPTVKNYDIQILGDKFLKKEDILKNISITKEQPLNVKEYQKTVGNIQKMYNTEGFQFVSVSSNIKIDGQKLSIEATNVNGKEYSNTDLLFIIKEYYLYDIELRGELKSVDVKNIKEYVDFVFKKDYEKKFFLLRPKKEMTYPTVSNFQMLFSSIQQIPYFTKDLSANFEPKEVEGTKYGNLVLVIDGKLNTIVNKDVIIKDFKYNNLLSYKKYEIDEIVDKFITKDSTTTNLDILNLQNTLLKKFKDDGYLFSTVKPEYDEESQTLNLNFDEKKFGDIKITKEATSKTQEYIINSLVKIPKDSVVNKKNLANTYTAFTGTGFFKDLKIMPTGMKDNKVDFTLSPIERTKSGRFNGGLTWTPLKDRNWYEGFAGKLDFSIPNYFGYGQTFGLDFVLTPLKEEYSIGTSYSVVKLFNSNFDLSTSVGFLSSKTGSYDQTTNSTVTESFSVSLAPSYMFSDFSYITTGISYKYSKELEGNISNRINGNLGYLYNRLDSPYRAYNGEYFKTFVLGGYDLTQTNKYYIGLNGEFKFFKSLYKFTFGSRIKIGYVEDHGDMWNYYVGGMTTVRGYDNSINGNNILLSNTELMYEFSKNPMPIDGFVFFDYGNTKDDFSALLSEPIWSFGAGLKLTIPVLGQIRLEYAFDKTLKGKLGIGIGQLF